jgi:hypothetical protein
MKKTFVILFLLLPLLMEKSISQSLRYFEFTTLCGHGNWQDTSFIAATNDQTVIDSVLTDLSRPYDERRFISGSIDHGNGGYNHNAGHWFLWHFIPGQWELADMSIEVCDGCPYSDVDADTAYWIGNLGTFCPWSGKPARELAAPVVVDFPYAKDLIAITPNPVINNIYIQRNFAGPVTITLFNSTGQIILILEDFSGNEISLPAVNVGLYFLKFDDGLNSVVKKFLVCM